MRSLFRFTAFFIIAVFAATAVQAQTSPPEPIISDEELAREVPSLDDAPLESISAWEQREDAQDAQDAQDASANPALQDGDPTEILPDPPVTDPLLDAPLPSIDSFDAEPPPAPTGADDEAQRPIGYTVVLTGLEDPADTPPGERPLRALRGRFFALSALDQDGRADNRATAAARARADRQLLLDLLVAAGFFDAAVDLAADPPATDDAPITIRFGVNAGRRYRLGTIAFDTPPVAPPDLVTRNFVPKPGDPIVADTILAAEANIAVQLPENGYPFVKLGQRDILLDPDAGTGDYTLPIDTGPRSYFGGVRTEGKLAFDADHIAILRRFRTGDLYDARLVDDLRAALVATRLLSTVSVEPVLSADTAPDGTAYADLLVRQEAGPPRTWAASAGYGTGQGLRAEGSWTHRNLFPPEGSLTVSAVAGTQEQAFGVAFARANTGRRDRNIELSASLLRSDYDAFQAYTGRLAGAISYVSTPIWQKRLTWAAGFELLATSENAFDARRAARDRRIYYVAALPAQVGFDRSDDLLDPVRGFRINLKLSPEAALGGGTNAYVRSMVEGTAYYSPTTNLVLAARARVGSIAGAERDEIAPSRRYYGGGGGSVRGFGYQNLGPRDPNGDPIGGRSLNEAAVEARYRFGNFGAAAFVDAGQVYASSLPQFDNWRFGIGIGGRFYTNFGPLRLDVATPINRRQGEARVSVYVSIGQAF